MKIIIVVVLFIALILSSCAERDEIIESMPNKQNSITQSSESSAVVSERESSSGINTSSKPDKQSEESSMLSASDNLQDEKSEAAGGEELSQSAVDSSENTVEEAADTSNIIMTLSFDTISALSISDESETAKLSAIIVNNSSESIFPQPEYMLEVWDGANWRHIAFDEMNAPNWPSSQGPEVTASSEIELMLQYWDFEVELKSAGYRIAKRIYTKSLETSFLVYAEFVVE